MEWLAGAILILGLYGAAVLRRHTREAKLLRLREMAHEEKIKAIERGLPIPDADASRIEALLSQEEGLGPHSQRVSAASVQWVRLAALALGLTLLFGGIGMLPGLYLQAYPEARDAWPVGLIPIFMGTGLLIFVRLSRGLAEEVNGTGKSC